MTTATATSTAAAAVFVLLSLAAKAAFGQAHQQPPLPSAFGTLPWNASIQSLPGKVWLAYFDRGGQDKAYHTYDDVNHGSCELNPCTGVNATYINTFRKDEGVSVSYTKPWFWWSGKAWSDRWAAGTPRAGENVAPMDEFYVGWFTEGSFLRMTVEVARPGTYTAALYLTCPNSGDLEATLSEYATGRTVSQQLVKDVPSTKYFHDWEIVEDAFSMTVPIPGLHVLTLNFTRVGGDPLVHWGNLIWADFAEAK